MNYLIKCKRQQGFTLIELLIVIVIIGILATALVPRLQNMQHKAKVSKVAADFKTIEKALMLTMMDENRFTLWTEAEIGLGGNPTFQAIYNKTTGTMSTFSNNLSSVPNNDFDASKQYRYDNDGDYNAVCTTSFRAIGANILFYGFGNDQTKIDAFDMAVDGKLGSCDGKFRYHASPTGDGGYHLEDAKSEY